MKSHSYSSSSILHRGKLLYVEAVLQGGAPWGFTLKGGIEHGEKIIISKVEEGGKAGLLQYPLEPGDQVVTINHVELGGSRQEAISLVKGSYKTLRLIVSRECSPDPRCSEAAKQRPASLPFSQGHPQGSQGCAGGVKLRIRDRQTGSTSRPHSWHSTKLGEGQQDPSMMQISQSSMAAPWHHNYHSSLSTTDLSSYDAGFLRKSPDQYSSRGSMESLDHGHPAYSSCHQLSSSKSSNSIDHLHNKRDSAYSSFSNSSSIPEYPPSGPSFSKERSYSMDSMLSQRGPEGMRQADMRYVRTVYDPQQGISEEHQVSSAKVLRNNEGRTHADIRGGMTGASANHALWGQTHGRNSCESLKGGPPPPLRSDSYAAIKNHERPNSWSSLEQTRSLRGLQKGFWHHNSSSFPLVKTFATDGQLHTVVEKSPESSPTTKPRQNFPQASQTGHPMLPTGIYPVPQPEPHYAQVPSRCPNSGGMCPALTKESVCSSYRDQERELNTEQSKTEKECQSQASSTVSQPNATKPKPPMHHDRRRPDDSDTKCSHYRPHFKTSVDGFGASQNQEDGYRHVSQNLNQERRDPYTRVKPREEKQRPSQSSEVCTKTREKEEIQANTWNHALEITHLQNKPLSAVAQDGFNCTQEMYGRPRDISVPASHTSRGDTARSQKNNGMRRVLPRQCSDSVLQKQKQQDHPLTKLENALIQVQNSAGSEAFVGQCSTRSEKDETDAVHLSVLEKVSRFEREQRRLYSQSDVLPNKRAEPRGNSSHSRTQSWSVERKDIVQLEDNIEPQQYLARHRMCGNQEPLPRNPHNKPMAIQRSKSTFQLGGNNEKEFHWKEDLEEILGTIQDVSYNKTYRDSIKDAQSKVLRSTSFRRRDLSAKPVPNKHLSLERKAPKTSPKPCVASLHTPKERHVVTPEVQKSAPPPLPSRPAVGFPVTRIGGRKRLTAEQKKRSYSEPENMHEVGLSRGEDSQKRAPQQFFIPETSVADRCKLFEMAATKSTGPSLSVSHSELKQIQQDALAEYMERKTGRRSSLQNRPPSAYMQAPCPDSKSVCASGFLFSQEQGFHFTSDSQKGASHMMYAIPSNLKGTVHPNGDTSEMPHLKSCSNNPASLHKDKDPLKQPFSHERELHKPGLVASSVPVQNQLHLQNLEETFERVAPPRNSGKSASAEDLLRWPEEERVVPQHYRSRSSPSMEKHYKDLTGADHAAFGVTSKHPFLNPSDSRPMKDVDQKQTAVPLDGDQRSMLSQGLSLPSAVRGEKPKPVERHRMLSAAGLAASVGLPCSFAPPPCTAKLNWHTDKSPYPTGLDTFARNTFPFLGQDGMASAESQPALAALTSFSDTSVLEEAPEEELSSKIPAARNAPSAVSAATLQNLLGGVSCSTSSESEGPSATQPQPLLSLRISESNLQASPPSLSFKDVVVDDDVFLEEPAQPSRCTPSTQDTDIKEGVPPPIPAYPPAGDGLGINTLNRRSVDRDLAEYHLFLPAQAENTDSPSKPILQSPAVDGETRSPPVHVAMERQNSTDEQEALRENPVLGRRVRSAEEVRVEALAQMLLSKDKSLAPILGTWAVKNTMDLMEDIFPALSPPLRPEKTSAPMEDRKQEPDKDLQNKPSGMETDLDKEEEYLKQKKTELLEALTLNIAALREEKAGLTEEQRTFSALEGHLETLIQECCKPSERDKYHMFVGDLDKIVNLLLSLCSRLVRVENSLRGLDNEDMEDNAKEKESLQLKQRQLRAQHQDARELKENLDRRERVVFEILAGYLGRQQLRDYQRFVQMKPALLIRQRCLDDLIREAEEQLQRVTERLLSEGHVPIQEEGLTSAAVSSSTRTPTVTSL